MNSKNGLDALLTPDNCVLLLIDHQPFQFAGLRSHDTQTIINNVVGLAKALQTEDSAASVSAVSPALEGTTDNATASVDINLPPGPSVLQATTSYTVVAALGTAATMSAAR